MTAREVLREIRDSAPDLPSAIQMARDYLGEEADLTPQEAGAAASAVQRTVDEDAEHLTGEQAQHLTAATRKLRRQAEALELHG